MIFQNWKKIKRIIEFWWFEKTFSRKFNFYTTRDPKELDELYHLRYLVYCDEYGYLDKEKYQNEREIDEYDSDSVHFILRDQSDQIAACMRIITNTKLGFPLENHFTINLNIPEGARDKFVEISRFIVAKKYRKKFIILALIKGIYFFLKENHITHVYAVLDEKLLNTLIRIGFPFRQIGAVTSYQGLTAPYIMDVAEMLENIKKVNPRLLNFASRGDMKYDPGRQQYEIN